MNRKQIAAVLGAAVLVVLSCTAGGCGSSGGGSSSGGGGSSLQCTFDTYLQAPVNRQLIATSSVTCDFTVVTSTTRLVIQGRRTGSDNTAWDNFSNPRVTEALPPTSLTYKVICVGGYDYQASASIDGVGPNGQPFHANDTTPVVSYATADCNQN